MDTRSTPTCGIFRRSYTTEDRSAQSRDIARSLVATQFYDVLGEVQNYEEIERALRSGLAKVALVVPPRSGSKVISGRDAELQFVVDGSDPQTVASALNTASSLVAARSSELLVGRLALVGGRASIAPIRLEPTTWYNPDLRTAVYVVPGLIGVILTMTMVMLTSMAIVRERERGTLEQLIVSPVKNIELVVGKILPYVIIGYVQITLIFAGRTNRVRGAVLGSVPLLYALSFVFIAANLALGLFFSTVAKTQQQAMQMSFFFLLPNILLSGFMFPFESMPAPAQWLSSGSPPHPFFAHRARHHLEGERLPRCRPRVDRGSLVSCWCW